MDQSHDILKENGKDFVFRRNFGDGIIYEGSSGGKTYKLKSVVKTKDGEPREATLEITSFSGSLGAVHHYARIMLDFPSYLDAKSGKPFVYSPYIDHGHPFGFKRVTIEVMRKVDRRDLKHDKEQAEYGNKLLYGYMKLGDYTHGFWSEEEATQCAIDWFKAHFDKDWILLPISWMEKTRPILAKGEAK